MNFRAYQQISKLLKDQQFDVIHCHTPIAGMIVRMAAARYRKKGTCVIYTTHGFSFTSRSSRKARLVYRTCEDVCSRLCDAIITINKEDYESAKKLHAPKVFYIHGVGVDTEIYRNVAVNRDAYRQSIGVESDEVMVLSVGELSHRKNHQIVVEALSKIPSDRKYVYVICGNGIDGGTGRQLQEMAEEKEVNLKLLGFRTDIPQITKCSDVGAIPSVREGLGLAGVQSLAAGVPVVGTDVQGIRDYIDPGNTGYLCDAFDANGYAWAIDQLASLLPEEKARMAQCCMDMAKHFDFAVSHKEGEKSKSRDFLDGQHFKIAVTERGEGRTVEAATVIAAVCEQTEQKIFLKGFGVTVNIGIGNLDRLSHLFEKGNEDTDEISKASFEEGNLFNLLRCNDNVAVKANVDFVSSVAVVKFN